MMDNRLALVVCNFDYLLQTESLMSSYGLVRIERTPYLGYRSFLLSVTTRNCAARIGQYGVLLLMSWQTNLTILLLRRWLCFGLPMREDALG